MVLKHVVTKTRIWYLMVTVGIMVVEVVALNGPNVCMVQQKYNITKRVKYRAPMSVRTYEWCFSMPPRCSKWRTEMRELTKLETDERIAEVAVCCPGYKMKDVSCVPICPNGKTGHHCSEDCPQNKWGPNCVNDCKPCSEHGACSPITGECSCQDGWQGESCENRMTTTTTTSEDLLTKATKPTPPATPAISSSTALIETTLVTALSTSTAILSFNTPVTESFLNKTPIPTTISSTVTTLPTTVKIIPTTEATSTTPLSTSHRVIVTEEPRTTEVILPSKKPPVAYKTRITATTEKKEETTQSSTVKTSTTSTTTSIPATTTFRIADSTKPVAKTTEIATNVSMYNRTEAPHETKTAKDIFVEVKSIPVNKIKTTTTETSNQHKTIHLNTSVMPVFTTYPVTIEGIRETTRRPDATIRYFPTTIKFKPKEIWIRPAQKEPEHITAVMEGKDKERTSVDLISVISIAGGIMMAVITVAVIIVMIERCRRPRYDDVRKMNDIHMQVMIDNNDVPPPYVRSIFHTPLPDPPTSEKCHYQPISTLDRNLKQFMRPVVVQTISPIMLENFRGILECHYDHLPRRSYNFEAHQKHCSITPSMDDVDELTCLRPCSVTESTIDALKCEAKLDMIDHTTSEPLYAEIPCWRPPSEHAIEVINLNGEAVTEL